MAQQTASTDHIRELHVRINELSEKFAMHDSRNAERFASLEQKCKQMEKDLDRQAIKLEAIETVVVRMDSKLDALVRDKRDNSDTDTSWRKREEVKADIWADRLKKIGLALLAAAALYFGGRGAVDQFSGGAANHEHEPKEQK